MPPNNFQPLHSQQKPHEIFMGEYSAAQFASAALSYKTIRRVAGAEGNFIVFVSVLEVARKYGTNNADPNFFMGSRRLHDHEVKKK